MEFKGNKAQEEAIRTLKGPVMIVSCPGSGKTTTLIRRIHRMIETGVSPSRILMVTFSRAAAEEMQEKYIKFFGSNPGVIFKTIHSLCFIILVKEGQCKKEDVLQESEKKNYITELLMNMPEAEGDVLELSKSVAREISASKNNCDNYLDYDPESCDTEIFRTVFKKYETWKNSIHKLDFDDMLIRCRDLLKSSDAIRKKWSGYLDYIQCDEYQDTNIMQRDILYMLAEKDYNLCVVGDDDQSIYRFRGARPEIMLHFMDDFPHAKKIMMGTNYRSAEEVVEHAGKIILKNKIRYGKQFVSQRGLDGSKGYTEYIRCDSKQKELEMLPEMIVKFHNEGIPYNEMAVLFRTNGQAVLPISALSTAGIPFCALDSVQCMYDGAIFKDIRAYTDLACGNYKTDDDMHELVGRVLNRPNRYLDRMAFSKVDYSPSGFHEAIYPLSKDAYWKYKQALEEVDNWMRLFGPGKLSMEDDPAIVFHRMGEGKTIRYNKHILATARLRKTDPDVFFEEYEEIKNDALNYRTIREWFAHADWMSKFIKEESKKKDKDGVVLATMHHSKGLEWKVVFIIDCNDGIIPHKNASGTEQGIEEERRLFYVAMTRAKDFLYVFNTNKNESAFIKEAGLLTAEERRLKAEIPKYLPGKCVVHKSFGEGKLAFYGPNTITVDFKKAGRKTFQFPKAFKDGFLSYK